ncbi:transmembrane protein 179B-like [Saccostrea echinata]|uniref:transmembrane protein 179B-like n=1 Tax=Saccostrea echinata TaxID=191078 RepID=UPI002A8065E2|nr:transmembrane protein 179B-like [Saccostrea echinata]
MAVFDVQLFVNTLLYFFIFVCGFAISIPLGVTGIENSGGCLLYATLNPYNSTYYTLLYSKKSNCDFPIYIGVFVCIFYALGMGIYNTYAIYKSQKDPSIASQMWVMPFIMINSLVTAVMFVASCMVSVGFKDICDSLTNGKYKYYPSCVKAENQKLVDQTTKKISSTGHFYTFINVTQTASWICTLGWLALVISGIVRFALNRRLRTQTSAPSDMTNIASIEPTA